MNTFAAFLGFIMLDAGNSILRLGNSFTNYLITGLEVLGGIGIIWGIARAVIFFFFQNDGSRALMALVWAVIGAFLAFGVKPISQEIITLVKG